MNPLAIIQEALQSIPAKVRKAILLVWALAVVAVGVLAIASVNVVFGLELDTVEDILLYLGLYLGVQSAANVSDKPSEH